MKIGIEKKEERWKLYVLGVLALGGAYAVYTNLTPDYPTSSTPTTTSAPKVATPAPAAAPVNSSPTTPRRRVNGRVAGDFRPKLRPERIEDRPDVTKIDPTINMALLTRVQNLAVEGGARNIFQFGAAVPVTPVTPLPKVKPIIPGQSIAVNNPLPSRPPGPPPPPQAPPIPLKYYGYSSVKGEPRKRAFFLDGEDIIVAWEGDMVKNRYKVVHIGLRTVEMEDTQFQNAKQSLQLMEDNSG